MSIATINPATGETIETFAPLSPAEIEKKLQLAVTAFRVERKTSFAERARNDPAWRYHELATHHYPHVSMPRETAELLSDFAKGRR